MKNIIFISILVFTVSQLVLSKENNKLDEVLNKIQDKYEKVNDFSSKFTQEATVRAINKVQKANGEVWFKKPGKMRWNYYQPSKDEIVSDGITIWFYDELENQVIVSPLNEVVETPTTTTLLSGLGNLKQLFNASFSKNNTFDEKDSYLIDLKPRDETEEFNKVTVAVDKNSLLVKTIYLYDPFGNLTKVKLKDIEINNGLSDSLFTFKAPKGSEIIKVPPSVKQ